MALPSSEINLRGQLQNTRVAGGIVLAKECAEHGSVTSRPEVVGDLEAGVVVENAGLFACWFRPLTMFVVLLTPENWVWLNTLNASTRNCKERFPLSRMESSSITPGPGC